MAGDKALRYEGGGSLSFRDGAGARRYVLHGASFLVDAATAKILLEDPLVVEGDADDVPRENTAAQVPVDRGRAPEADETPPQIDVATATKADLLAYAKLLGLTMAKSTKIARVRSSIEKELKRRQALGAPLADPLSTALATGEDVPFSAIRNRARELGIKFVAVGRPELVAAIAVEEQRIADEAASQAISNPGGVASGEATPPEPGAITLGDIPKSGIAGQG